MATRQKIKIILKSLDIWVSIAVGILCLFLFPKFILLEEVKDIFSLVVTVLSIIFSFFTAALAVIVISEDTDFIIFMKEENIYEHLIWHFKFTLWTLFTVLLISIFLFVLTSLLKSINISLMFPGWGLAIFFIFFPYSLFCSLQSALDSISYAQRRSVFLSISHKEKHFKKS